TLVEVAAPRRCRGDCGRHQWDEPAGRSGSHLLSAATNSRVHRLHPRRAGRDAATAGRHRRSAGDRPHTATHRDPQGISAHARRLADRQGRHPSADIHQGGAMTAAVVGLSHSPLIGKNDPDPDVLARVETAVDTARRFITDFDPELVILYAPDHY